MSEPVGNLGRPGMAGNSHKSKEQAKPAEAPPAAQKIVQGRVVRRKQAWWKRATTTIVAEDATNVGGYVMDDIILPAIRNVIADIVTQGTNRILFGQSMRARNLNTGGVSGIRNKYHGIPVVEAPRALSMRDRARHNFDDIILTSRQEAVEVIQELGARIDSFGMARVSDLYDFLGVTGSHADQNWGWYELGAAQVRQDRDGWRLDLPNPEQIRP